jgi:hypothetical protein
MAKTYSLSKQENDILGKIISTASMQEEILEAIRIRYSVYVQTVVFKRLSIDKKLFPKCAININTGELIINEEPKRKENRDIQNKR